jgi:histidyl-tRNA synthetase
MFRHERPQKGRYRQFHQIGVETFGVDSPDIDAELILMGARLWRDLGLNGLTLQLNSLGSNESRNNYRAELVSYLKRLKSILDEDSLRRLEKNPLRILDSKNPVMQKIISGAPSILDYLDEPSRQHFEMLGGYLKQAGISYLINPAMVRGLDYYTRTVFEWTTDRMGAQSTVCAGGRYDKLVEQLGGKPTPATGFALGMERLAELLALRSDEVQSQHPHAYLVVLGEKTQKYGLMLSEQLRDADLHIESHCGGGGLKAQLKRADRCGARFALLLGEEEIRNRSVSVKDLRDGGSQSSVSQEKLIDYLNEKLGRRMNT